MISKLRISYYTPVMNRAFHLKATLPRNVASQPADGVEFVIANYGSRDDLDDWMASFLASHPRAPVRYVRNMRPRYYQASRAKNFGCRACTGDVVCNLDADNFLGAGFTGYLRDVFEREPDSLVRVTRDPSTAGRIALLRDHFDEIDGYNVRFRGWGHEDDDLAMRACAMRHLAYHECQLPEFAKFISHSDAERTRHTHPELAAADKWRAWSANSDRMLFRSPEWRRGLLIPRLFHLVTVEGERERHWRRSWSSWQRWHPGWEFRVWPEIEAAAVIGPAPRGLAAERRRAWFGSGLLFREGGIAVHPGLLCDGPIEPVLRHHSAAVLPGTDDVLFRLAAGFRRHSLFRDIVHAHDALRGSGIQRAFQLLARRHHWNELAPACESGAPYRAV